MPPEESLQTAFISGVVFLSEVKWRVGAGAIETYSREEKKVTRKISYHSSSLARGRVRESHLNVFIGRVRKVWRSVAIGETRPLEAGRRPFTPGETSPSSSISAVRYRGLRQCFRSYNAF